MKRVLLFSIKIYQKTFSPDHAFWAKARYPYGYCRFYPTCSQYAYEAIDRFGSIKGIYLATKRILRCNPFSKGGIDLVEKR